MANNYTNHKGIKGIKPPEKGQIMYSDTQTRGLYLRAYSSGLKTFIHRYKVKGETFLITFDDLALNTKSTESEISQALAQARARVAENKAKIKQGENPAIERNLKAIDLASMPTLEQFAHIYIERYAKVKKKSWAEDDRMLKVDVLPILGDMPLDKIERKHLIALLDKKEDAGALVARDRLISLISKVFSFAIDRAIVNNNPIKGIQKSKVKTRSRVLSDQEIRLFWERTETSNSNGDPATRLALRLTLVTGQRAGEICQLHEQQIKGNIWTMPATKNGRIHTVYLSPLAQTLIQEARPYSRNGFLFVNRLGEPKDEKTLAKAMKQWGLEWEHDPEGDPTPHDLRRTFTTRLASLGFDRFVQNLVTNHADKTIGAVYDRHSYAKEKQLAMEAWERKLNEITGQQPEDTTILPFVRKLPSETF